MIKSHIPTHEEQVTEAIAMVFNKARVGPEELSGCLQPEKKGLTWMLQVCCVRTSFGCAAPLSLKFLENSQRKKISCVPQTRLTVNNQEKV